MFIEFRVLVLSQPTVLGLRFEVWTTLDYVTIILFTSVVSLLRSSRIPFGAVLERFRRFNWVRQPIPC